MIRNKLYELDIESVLKNIPNMIKLKDKNVMITGCTGLIGSAVTDVLLFLNEKYHYNMTIYLAARNETKVSNRFENLGNYVFIHYDALSDIEFNNISCDYLIHCASNASPNLYVTQPIDTLLSNIYSIDNLCKYAVKNSCRLLYVSSSEVYGLNSFGNMTEDDYEGGISPLDTRSSYAIGKLAAENLCQAYFSEHLLDFVIVRPGHIYGPGFSKDDNRVAAQFFIQGLRNKRIVLKSEGQQIRSYCYTLDCASAILSVLLNGEKANAYNIASLNSVISIRGFAEEIAKQLEVSIVFERENSSEKKQFNKMKFSNLNPQKLEQLGWNPEFSLSKGISRTIFQLKSSI